MSEALNHADTTAEATGSTTTELPRSYLNALQNRFTAHELTDLLKSPVKPAFFYGSLMLPEDLGYALGDGDRDEYALAVRMTPAVLYKHQRFGIHGLSYPAVLPSQHDTDTVSGMVVFGITVAQQEELDLYESQYERTPVQVEVELLDGQKVMIAAEVYIWKRGVERLIALEQLVWSIENYLG
ncbi:hypothetical protein MMC17_003137 [Xylographa soralifera]|nr:hypothetical protein [Xylographa soralifera]